MVTGSKPNRVGNLKNVRCEASRQCSKQKKKYLKAKIDELETKIKIKTSETCIGASVTMKGYQPRTNKGKD